MTIYNIINYVYLLILAVIIVLAGRQFIKSKKWIEKITIVIVVILFMLRLLGIK